MKVRFSIAPLALLASVSFPSLAQSSYTLPAQSLNQLTLSGISTEVDMDGGSKQNAFDGGGALAELRLQWQNDWYVGLSGRFSETRYNDVDLLTDELTASIGTHHFLNAKTRLFSELLLQRLTMETDSGKARVEDQEIGPGIKLGIEHQTQTQLTFYASARYSHLTREISYWRTELGAFYMFNPRTAMGLSYQRDTASETEYQQDSYLLNIRFWF
ncbi:hypothetical protein [Idiomarina sp. UBA3162]|jgi:hypothetical protein|uniref:hypothetical protein n=1 Tax=unclassified Idiomarina TaxID=2614829 RepID=UPI000C90AE83|nr:hypothetical protein [Idiomarina sp. UBA3162]MAD53138.1 hypothetical protein [Idiomarinaceae bacterium]|tara:strand:+ start:2629 stop:3273 length:645 start_codon:yes stop_codon:yes gene_type:complete